MKKNKILTLSAVVFAAGSLAVACSDDNEQGGSNVVDPQQMSFVVTSSDPASDLAGGAFLKVFSDLSTPKTDQSVYNNTEGTTKSYDSFTQVTYNPQSGVFTGYIYARGASAQGIGEKKAGLRSYKLKDGVMTEIAAPVLTSAFGNTGIFSTYSYAAQISNPYSMVVDKDGQGKNIELALPQYAIDGVNPGISNIIDLGNNKVAIVLNYSNRDSAVVAFADCNLSISKVVYSSKIGRSVGAWRSVRYTQSGTDGEGNLYVFCGSSSNEEKVGAIRVKKGESEFDNDYKFDIFKKADGYRFRKAFHISDDKFLLEFYTDKTKYGNMNTSGKMAVVDMSDQSFVWVSGSEYLNGSQTNGSIGWGDGYQGNYYLPVTPPTGTTMAPTIYKINASTGVATPFMTFKSSDLLKAITVLK